MEGRLYLIFLVMSSILLACSLGTALYVDVTRERTDVDMRIRETAKTIASLDGVKEMLETGYPDAQTIRTLDAIVSSMERIDAVLVCDRNSLRFYQTDRLAVGDTYMDGHERAILQGAPPYITTVYNTRGMQRCAFHGIENETGTLSGFVVVAIASAHITGKLRSIALLFLGMFVVMLLLSAVLSRAFLKYQSRALMGLSPRELLGRYLRQDETITAYNHEFLNKLHVILGYLQTGDIERAKDFIINAEPVSSEAIREVTAAIRDPGVCALIIGKMMFAAEQGIRLTLLPESDLPETALIMRPDEYVTVIGNLVENAIEELAASGGEAKDIDLGIYCLPELTMITCEDTGRGIPESLRAHIFEKGASSKGKGHGTGLYLVKKIADAYGGEIIVDTTQGEGTCFTFNITRR